MQRYFIVSCLTFSIDYSLALTLIYLGLEEEISLATAATASVLTGYGGLELWAFKKRKASLSLWRFLKYCLGALAIYLTRLIFLKVSYLLLGREQFWQQVTCLFIAYGFAFIVGYLIQSQVVFQISKRSE